MAGRWAGVPEVEEDLGTSRSTKDCFHVVLSLRSSPKNVRVILQMDPHVRGEGGPAFVIADNPAPVFIYSACVLCAACRI